MMASPLMGGVTTGAAAWLAPAPLPHSREIMRVTTGIFGCRTHQTSAAAAVVTTSGAMEDQEVATPVAAHECTVLEEVFNEATILEEVGADTRVMVSTAAEKNTATTAATQVTNTKPQQQRQESSSSSSPASPFEVTAQFEPTGDQPAAIRQLLQQLQSGDRFSVLQGITGTG